MSLTMLFDPATVDTMMTAWPDKPSVHHLPADSPLPRILTAQMLHDYLDTGCIPPGDINIIRNAAPRHPASFTTNGRLDPTKVAFWRERGYTVHLRHLEKWSPPMRVFIDAIQRETGYAGYASAFTTPPGQQGLEWHWDQDMGFVVQLSGTKTWPLWAPIVEDPMLDYHSSVQPRPDDWVQRCKDTEPDLTVELTPGQVLILPRGWIHSPYSEQSAEQSVHVTVVVQERTPLWIAQHLVRSAITNNAFRQVIPPADLTCDALTARIDQARDLLTQHLNAVDTAAFADLLRGIAETEREPAPA